LVDFSVNLFQDKTTNCNDAQSRLLAISICLQLSIFQLKFWIKLTFAECYHCVG
jgi:hypothetical protein